MPKINPIKANICTNCAAEFKTSAYKRKYCDACLNEHKKQPALKPKEAELGVVIKSMIVPCLQCGQRFVRNAKSTEVCEACLYPSRRSIV